MTKQCTKCLEHKPATTQYFSMNKGKLKSWCKKCYCAQAKIIYANNREHLIAGAAARVRNLKAVDPEGYRKKKQVYNNHWSNSDAGRAANNRKMKKRYANRPEYALAVRMKSRMSKILRDRGGSKGGKSWQELVGYSAAELRAHIESRFHPGMSWENKHLWHIDHIKPISTFSFNTPQDVEFRLCWALENLTPLWGSDNVKKSNKY